MRGWWPSTTSYLEVQKVVDRPLNKAPADTSSSGKRDVYGCRQDDQVAFENEMTSIVNNEMGGARSVRLRKLFQ